MAAKKRPSKKTIRSKGYPSAGPRGRVGKVSEPSPASATWIGAGEFKARCLELMALVSQRHEEIVVTKRGVPLVRIVPASGDVPDTFGYLRGTVVASGDLTRPDPDEWGEHA